MPRYLSLLTLPGQYKHYIRPLTAAPDPNPLTRNPTPSDRLFSLPPEKLPPNIRVQDWVDDRNHWRGVGTVARLGGKKRKDLPGIPGREARKLGGLKWALRER